MTPRDIDVAVPPSIPPAEARASGTPHYAAIAKGKLAASPPGPLPLDAPCPNCGASKGIRCFSGKGFPVAIHLDRWHAVGVSKPNSDDLIRTFWDGEVRGMATAVARTTVSPAAA